MYITPGVNACIVTLSSGRYYNHIKLIVTLLWKLETVCTLSISIVLFMCKSVCTHTPVYIQHYGVIIANLFSLCRNILFGCCFCVFLPTPVGLLCNSTNETHIVVCFPVERELIVYYLLNTSVRFCFSVFCFCFCFVLLCFVFVFVSSFFLLVVLSTKIFVTYSSSLYFCLWFCDANCFQTYTWVFPVNIYIFFPYIKWVVYLASPFLFVSYERKKGLGNGFTACSCLPLL